MPKILLIAIVLVACTQGPETMGVGTDNIPKYEKIKVIGEKGKHGMFDPSVAYGKDGTGWLVYSSVNAPVVNTNLAVSNNGGKTWKFVRALNKPAESSVRYKGREVKGFWVHETPGLFHAPEDKGREWKLYWHKYFFKAPYKPKDHIWTYGGIAYKYASNPSGQWSEEKMLLAMETYGKFYDKKARILKDIDPSLKKYALFYEPGVIMEDGIIYLSLDASVPETGLGKWSKRKIVLVSSPDHGKTWEFVNNLTDSGDAKKLGYLAFSASSIVREKGRLFLLVAPVGSLKGKNKAHNGTYIFEFADISRGLLKRNTENALMVHKFIQIGLSQDGSSDYYETTQGGPSDYDENNSYGGIIFPQRNPKWAPNVFRLYNTRIKVVD